MNDYTGKICPFCKTEFKPNDEIIVCSECEMPHHKDCWITNQGCTTFGCSGTIESADNTVTSVTAQNMTFEDVPITSTEDYVYCTNCGSQNTASSLFCRMCGNRIVKNTSAVQSTAYTQSNPADQNAYSYANQYNTAYQQQSSYSSVSYNAYQSTSVDADIQHLIGVNSEYYVSKFQEIKAQNNQASWNWAAFLFGPYWMIYRRMYGYGTAFLAAIFLITLINSLFLSLISFGIYIVVGILGNSIYMKSIDAKAAQAKSMNESLHSQYIVRNSGVNTTAAILTVVGYALLWIIVSI